MCVRGLKPLPGTIPLGTQAVARRVRAWIETIKADDDYVFVSVARRVRAWIETCKVQSNVLWLGVARRVRAWIETRKTRRLHFPV